MGGYERLLEQPVAGSSALDFIVFTDDAGLTSETWRVRTNDLILPLDSARSSRYAKLLPHRVLPEYDVSIYIDNCVLLRERPEIILQDLLPSDAAFVLNAHDFRETVGDEFEAVVHSEKDVSWVCAEQLEHYDLMHPEVLLEKPLWSGFMIRRHHDPLLVRTMELWWTHVLRYSRRDQLSLPMALRESGLQPTVLSNGLHESRYHEWPMDVGRVPARSASAQTPTEDHEQELADMHEQLEAERQASVDLRARVGGLVEDVDRLQGAIEDRDVHIRTLLGSTSWKITAPLRWLGDRVKRRPSG